MCKYTTAREVWGHTPHKLEAMKLLLRPFWAKMMLLGGQTTEFNMHEYLPFLLVAPYSTAWFQLSNCSLISQATPFTDEAC